eukprot:5263758-Lingulodinium_polyedra.AAC.2
MSSTWSCNSLVLRSARRAALSLYSALASWVSACQSAGAFFTMSFASLKEMASPWGRCDRKVSC